MTKSYLTHLSTVFAVHVLIFMGTWQLSQTDYFKTKMKSVGEGVMKLQVASQILSSPAPRKKIETKLPSTAVLPQDRKLQETSEVTTPQTNSQATSQGSEAGTSSQGKTDLRSIYKAELRAMIDKNKSYPPMSRRLGQTGTVVVTFTLLEDGNIIDVKVKSPSPFDRLNASAMEAVKKVGRFKPIPKELGEEKMELSVPLNFFTI